MLAKQLKQYLDQLDESTEIEIVSGFQILNLAEVYDQGQLLDYLVRPHQLDTSLKPEARRVYIKQNAKVVELIENTALWSNSVFLVAVASDTTHTERP
jgi:hypothetical protein